MESTAAEQHISRYRMLFMKGAARCLTWYRELSNCFTRREVALRMIIWVPSISGSVAIITYMFSLFDLISYNIYVVESVSRDSLLGSADLPNEDSTDI